MALRAEREPPTQLRGRPAPRRPGRALRRALALLAGLLLAGLLLAGLAGGVAAQPAAGSAPPPGPASETAAAAVGGASEGAGPRDADASGGAARPAAQPLTPAPADLRHQVDEPRAYGHLVGDVVERRVQLALPPGLRLRGDSLPVAGRRGQALELREVLHAGPHDARHQTLTLRYQVFAAPRQPRVLELPPVLLDFEPLGGGRVQTLRIDAWPLQLAPLGPEEAANRRGLGPLQPDLDAPALDTRAIRLRLALWLGGLLAVLLGLGWMLLLRPYRLRRRQAFARLRRELAGLPAQALAEDARAVFARVHAALRAQAGRNLLARDLPDYLAARPGLAALADELRAFHQASEVLFFQPGAKAAPDWDLARLRRLAGALAEVERLAPGTIAGPTGTPA